MLNIIALRIAMAEAGVEATSVARAQLTTTVAKFKKLGAEARPVVFGSHRKPQAVLLPYDMFVQILDIAEGLPSYPKTTEPATATKEQKEIRVEKDHLGSSTQELLDQIMAKWNL